MSHLERHDPVTIDNPWLNIIFQNLVGRPIIIAGSVLVDLGATPGIAQLSILTDASSPPSTIVAEVGAKGGVVSQERYMPFYFQVQPNHYWQIRVSVGSGATVDQDVISGWAL